LNSSEIKNSVIIISEKPLLNPAKIKIYPNLSINYSIYLNTLLFSNWVELLSSLNEECEIVFFLDKNDEEYLSNHFVSHNTKTIFYTDLQNENFSEQVSKYLSGDISKTLILFNNSIGMTRNDIFRIFNLIQSDEQSIAIGKSRKDQVVFICTARADLELVNHIFLSQRSYTKYLKSISAQDIFIQAFKNILSLNDFEDIKNLYIELSKKESLSYCSPKMHESFNDLFIEYKDLLNG